MAAGQRTSSAWVASMQRDQLAGLRPKRTSEMTVRQAQLQRQLTVDTGRSLSLPRQIAFLLVRQTLESDDLDRTSHRRYGPKTSVATKMSRLA